MEQIEAVAKIEHNRALLDAIDKEIVALYEKRMDVVTRIGSLKKEADLPVLDEHREKRILESRRNWLMDKGHAPSLDRLFELLMLVSRESQQDIVQEAVPVARAIVAYQGVPGSYGHEAAKSFFKDVAEYFPCEQFMDTLEAIVKGQATYAVLPIENSIAGMVYQAQDILVKYRCYICGEIILPICHCLLGAPGVEIQNIKEIHSHPQALAQCSEFFMEHPEIEQKAVDNTALAAKTIAESGSKQIAAIASKECRELYGLSLLAEGIQNRSENFTRFMIISRSEYNKDDWNKVSVRFTLPHESGSLYEMLRIPSEERVNLTSIVSRPHPGRSFSYYFFVEMTWEDIGQMGKCLERMKAASDEWVLLGRYASAERRNEWDAFI